jgi:phage terminase small subunit
MRRDKLTSKQAAFVQAYLALGGRNGRQAAINAGYSAHGPKSGKLGAAVVASRMLRDPKILAELKRETESRLRAGVVLAGTVLEELARDAQSESVRLSAAQALLDRGGLMLTRMTEHTVTLRDERSDTELWARIGQLQRELGSNAKVIEAAVERESLPTPSDIAVEEQGDAA